MEKQMFCYQCQETAFGTGCVVRGVCGKQPATAHLMDLLLFSLKGVGVVATLLNEHHIDVPAKTDKVIVDGLFSTITNANFDNESISAKITNALDCKRSLVELAKDNGLEVSSLDAVALEVAPEDYEARGREVGVLKEEDENLRSLKELTMYGLKGMAAYYEHADRLGHTNREIIRFMERALATVASPSATEEQLLQLVLETGKYGVDVMALLDKANTDSFGQPEATHVNIGVGNKPGILISGHDLADIEQLLEQTQGTGVDVYTHGEMLPAHYYPRLKKYSNLVGNYGNAWWKQKEEFSHFNGPIIFTTNCIVPPLPNANYKDRVFTANSTGYPGWKHIPTDARGRKDFSEVIEMARHCQAPDALEQGEIVGGFAHNQVVALADQVVEAVKSGAIRKFVVMSGCDGRMKSRNYYTDFAKALPKDVVILTSGCAKYKYNKLNLGDINGIPRVLDAGQCNDSYTWVVVALKLKEIFGVESVNQLPIVFNIAWYEQKAVIVLLALLSLGIKNIHIGPTLPAFVSPAVLKVLQSNFGLGTITTVDEDVKTMIS
ncbi:MAG: hydroxylamine reductase [Bacteroidales bacterium]|nr:hydroxylamine reductase [Bacteroidales bacterium]MDD7706097.1 hydroxylamine reductase [Bacteroidales bacterium]MDY4705249.1 hydroxylamine reductase [Prevotella sp.]MDY5320360.1 hydroxylamine reductase [Prevotella sp.]